jgi:hypothetical protein
MSTDIQTTAFKSCQKIVEYLKFKANEMKTQDPQTREQICEQMISYFEFKAREFESFAPKPKPKPKRKPEPPKIANVYDLMGWYEYATCSLADSRVILKDGRIVTRSDYEKEIEETDPQLYELYLTSKKGKDKDGSVISEIKRRVAERNEKIPYVHRTRGIYSHLCTYV